MKTRQQKWSLKNWKNERKQQKTIIIADTHRAAINPKTKGFRRQS